MLDKPLPAHILQYDYIQCSNYLQEKYGYKERDYGRSPHRDFWNFLVCNIDIVNHSNFIMDKEMLMEEANDWQTEILQYFFDEFDPDNTGEINFYVYW